MSRDLFQSLYFIINHVIINILGVKVMKEKRRTVDKILWELFDKSEELTSQRVGLSVVDPLRGAVDQKIKEVSHEINQRMDQIKEREWEERARHISQYDSARQPKLFYGELRKLKGIYGQQSPCLQVYDPSTLGSETPQPSVSLVQFKQYWRDYFKKQGDIHTKLSKTEHKQVALAVTAFDRHSRMELDTWEDIRMTEVEDVLKNANRSSSVGLDQVSYHLIELLLKGDGQFVLSCLNLVGRGMVPLSMDSRSCHGDPEIKARGHT